MGHARPSTAPAIYGRYETLFRIAAGGMAEVYAARQRGEAGFQKLVALKRMLPHLTDDERFVNMFMDEGRLAANIDSPNVVSTMDLGRADDGSLYLVMELVVGATLSSLLRNAAKDGDSVPIDVAVEMLAQAAQGLHDAHEARTPFGAPLQLVHRDVSPQNILVGVDGRVRITDFGVARAVLRRTKTSTGEFKGKLSYFSPEQCADKDLDRRSDVFSLGVVAWETLTTRRLFHAENPLAVLERVTRMPIPSAHSVRPEVPASVAAVVQTALERDRDERFSTAAEFASALRAAAREASGIADRKRVGELCQQYGGDGLERVQEQLKISLSSPGLPTIDDFEAEKTEISSGIVMRPEDEGPMPATPRAPTAAQPAPSRAPLVIASLVAVLGLGVGLTVGVLAMQADAPESAAERVEVEAAAQVAPTALPPATDEAPEGAEDEEAAVEEEPPSAEDDAAEAADRPRRPRTGRGRVRRPTPRVQEPAPVEPPPAAESAPA
ncbi:MAG: serine/threonine-protein kinase, partial [Myxococcota bacterium]|nr:serine/threonine-protein kinase [Myxococcota bacterium]